MVSLYGFEPGSVRQLPLRGAMKQVFVAGVWRDYARQTGAITMRPGATTAELTGDDYRLRRRHLARGGRLGGARSSSVSGSAAPVLRGCRRFAGRARSGSCRWRSSIAAFAVTYVLEAIAIVVGLFGVASTYAAEALNRAREFGMMRHLGVSRRMVMGQLAIEATIGTLIALCGAA